MITPYKHYCYDNGNINFRVGLYSRLSREDEKEHTSESIQNQVEFLEQIILQNGWTLVDKYIDDGISGTTFERPDFKRMISDIEAGRINLVITKDLSRLGRDYIQTGYYLENYFPSKNIRYIAVNDGFDTFEEASSNDFIPFKSVFNDMYAKDISKKVRTALKTKQVAGLYIGNHAPLGYQKDIEQKGHLIPDPVSAAYVRRIFEKYLAGVPMQSISIQLTQEGIPTPSQYAGNCPTQERFIGVWNDKTVRVILKNEVYIGHTVQNKAKKVNYKLDKQVNLPSSQWIKVENTHEPIIPLEDFQAVQALLEKKSHPNKGGTMHLFTGFVFCGHCGTPYSYTNQHQKGKFYLICGTAKRHRKLGLCKTFTVREEILQEHILALLREIAEQYIKPTE
ncbi:MAG: recombinase family protein [Oscillospiraceae bacterium]|nr:recombinase family protein [Oscillospiraceae bacterium]